MDYNGLVGPDYFKYKLDMEGTGLLENGNGKSILVNFADRTADDILYEIVNSDCQYGYGNNGDCLIPFVNVAVDLPTGSVVHFKQLQHMGNKG